jgi:2-phosphosulfolactate phosphatase
VQEEWATQADFDVRFDWGAAGVRGVEAGCTVVIVDVLRFTTAVESATSCGAAVYPYRWRDESADEFAQSLGAHLANGDDPSGFSLSPISLLRLLPADNVVLPSPNGSTCAVIAAEREATVLAGCLRNAAAIGEYLRDIDSPITVIACGERWPDGSLRPSLEDLLGAGAILAELGGRISPEARAAVWAWNGARGDVESVIRECASGKELVARGHLNDVIYASEVNSGRAVPMLTNGAFRWELDRGTSRAV